MVIVHSIWHHHSYYSPINVVVVMAIRSAHALPS